MTRSAATLRCSRCRSFYNTNTQQKKCHFANAVGGNRRQCNNLHSLSALRATTVPSETDLDNDCQYDGISRTFVVEMKNCNAQQNNKNDMKDIFASSNCWGRRPFLLRGAFDPNALLGIFGDEEDDVEVGAEEDDQFLLDTPWPSWKDVVDIASDDEAEARYVKYLRIILV